MATIKEILSLNPSNRHSTYGASGIEKVTIDGNEFTDYKAFSFIWEKSYVKSPERSSSGAIDNLNSYAWFLTPHLKIDFSLLSIDSYRTLMKLIYSKNEFLVKCYDVVYNKITTNKMYFSTEEMPTLWAICNSIESGDIDLLGVQDYTVEMVGTNSEVETISLMYKQPNGTLIDSVDIALNDEVVMGNGITMPTISGYIFANEWYINSSYTGIKYIQGNSYRISQGDIDTSSNTFTLYAKYNENT